jgi:hypothetical protein
MVIKIMREKIKKNKLEKKYFFIGELNWKEK